MQGIAAVKARLRKLPICSDFLGTRSRGVRGTIAMASRKEQKEAARQRRLAEEQAARQKVQRTRRLQGLGAVVVAAIIVVVVLVVVSSGGGSKKVADPTNPESQAAKSTAASVNASLQGIPQSGNVLGKPSAKITMTEYGDLECPICRDFALGAETQLIANEVRSGQVKLVYKSFKTASGDADAAPNAFSLQQAAAYAAGAQNKAWNYILLFYHEQQTENTPYVTASFLTGLAKQVSGLDVSKWNNDRFNPKYAGQVVSDGSEATKLNLHGTPSISFSGPKAQTQYYDGALSYSQVQQAIKQVS